MSKTGDATFWGSHVLACSRQRLVAPVWTPGTAVVQ